MIRVNLEPVSSTQGEVDRLLHPFQTVKTPFRLMECRMQAPNMLHSNALMLQIQSLNEEGVQVCTRIVHGRTVL